MGYYMYVVSDSGSILGGILVSEDGEFGSLAHDHLRHIWHEVVGHAIRILP